MAWESLFKIERAGVASALEHATLAGPALTYGPPGTGKTSDWLQVADRLGIDAYVLHCDGAAMAQQFIGQHSPGTKGNWRFHAGVILQAMGHGPTGAPGLLLIDDLHELGPDGLAALYVACDGFLGQSITLEDECPCGCGEITVYPKSGYRVGATMNGFPEMLPEPIRSRFRAKIGVETPSPAQLAALTEPLGDLCDFDYSRGAQRVAEYREYRALSDMWSSGTALKVALGLALDDAERARKVCVALAMAEPPIAEAVALLQLIQGAAPSGAPDVSV